MTDVPPDPNRFQKFFQTTSPTQPIDDRPLGGGAENLARQAGAGVLDFALTFPALGFFGSKGLQLAQEAVTGEEATTFKQGADFFAGEIRRVLDINNELAGVQDPSDFVEELARIAPVLIPGGQGPAILSKGGSTTAKVAANAAEFATPLLLGPVTTTRVAANLAVPFAATQGIAEFLETEDGDGYFSVVDFVEGEDKPPIPGQDRSQDPNRFQSFFEAQNQGQLPDPDRFRAVFQDRNPIPPPPENDDGYSKALMVAGGLALLGGIAGYRRFAARPPKAEGVSTGTDNPVSGPLSATTPQEAFQTVNQDGFAVLNHQSKRSFDDGSRTPQQLDDATSAFNAELHQTTRTGGSTAAEFVINTGLFPNMGGRELRSRISPKAWQLQRGSLEGAARTSLEGLSPDARRILDNHAASTKSERRAVLDLGMIAGDAVDQRILARAADNADPNVRPSASLLDDNDLRIFQRAMRNDPDLNRLSNDFKDITQTTLKYLNDLRLIADDKLDGLLTARPNFLPNFAKEVPTGSIMQRLFKTIREASEGTPEANATETLENLLPRSVEDFGGVQQFLNPGQALEDYVQHAVLAAQRNKLRVEFIDNVISERNPDELLRQSIKKVDGASEDNPNVLGVYRNGKLEHYEFGDPLVRTALQFAPFTSRFKMFNLTRQIVQQGTTGLLQPFFALKTFFWDAQVTAALRNSSRSFGTTGVKGDPLAFIDSLAGIPQNLGPRAALELANRIEASLLRESGIFSQIPREARRMLADRMLNTYTKSMRGVLDRYGGFNVNLTTDATETGMRKLLESSDILSKRLGPSKAGLFINSYKGLIESIHNSSKIRLFHQNFDESMTPKQIRKLVQEVRESVGDFSKRGLGRTNTKLREPQTRREVLAGTVFKGSNAFDTSSALIEAVPYYNVTLQALTRFGKAFGQDKLGTMQGVFLAAVMPALAGAVAASLYSDDEHDYRDFYWNRQPGWWRTTNIYLPIPGLPPEEGITIPLAPEFGWISTTIIGGVDQFYGLSNRNVENPALNDAYESLASFTGLIVPPPLAAATNVAGFQAELGFDPISGSAFGLRPVSSEQVTGGEVGRTTGSILDAKAEAVVTSLFGTVSRMVIETLNAAGQAQPEDLLDAAATQASFEAAKRIPLPLGLFSAHSVNNNKVVLLQKQQATERIISVFTNSVLQRGIASQGTPLNLSGNLGPEVTNPKFIQAAPLISSALQSNPAIMQLSQFRNALKKELSTLKGTFPKTAELQKRINEETFQIQDLETQMAEEILRVEYLIGQQLRVPDFRIEDLDPYAKP